MDTDTQQNKNKQKKAAVIASLEEKFKRAKSVVFADYKGLKHKQLEELRKGLKKENAELVVAKNTLIKRALGEQKEAAEMALAKETAVLLSYKDEVSGVKALLTFFKEVALGTAKGGLLGEKALSPEETQALANIPSKDVLLGRLVGQLQAPISGLHYTLSWNINKLVWALNAVKETKN